MLIRRKSHEYKATDKRKKKQVFAKTIDFFSALSFDETFKHKFSLAAVVGKRKRRHLERVRRPASTTQKNGSKSGKRRRRRRRLLPIPVSALLVASIVVTTFLVAFLVLKSWITN
jgi:hypothetical protein